MSLMMCLSTSDAPSAGSSCPARLRSPSVRSSKTAMFGVGFFSPVGKANPVAIHPYTWVALSHTWAEASLAPIAAFAASATIASWSRHVARSVASGSRPV